MLCGSDPAVRVEDLTLRFKTTREKKHTVQRRLHDMRHRRRSVQVVEALKGVSFDVPLGTVYGVVGRNGAGKSTLLRAIAGILPPTSGRISVYRRVTPLLSLGVGFNPELTGRENILLGGLAAGLEYEQIQSHVDEIVTFADIGASIDYPMRTYSTGMGGRLAFAVAAHLDPEIILIDEALAAGDARFKHKCRDRIAELCDGNCTVILVSHGLGIITTLAKQVLWIQEGTIQQEGDPEEVVAAYLEREGVGADETSMLDL